MKDDDVLAQKRLTILPHLNEKQRRLVLAAEARSLGYGGVSQVARVTGISRPTLHQGLRELESDEEPKPGIRRAGGGRKRVEAVDLLRNNKENRWNAYQVKILSIITQQLYYKLTYRDTRSSTFVLSFINFAISIEFRYN